MHGHLVTVKVRVERGTDQRVNADGFAFDERRLERLNAEAVQGGSAIQQNRVLADDIFQDVPNHGLLLLHHFLGLLDGGAVALCFELVIDEWLEQLERHLLRQTALIELQFRTNHDDGAAGVVHTLAEQVLAETALLALKRVRQRFERTVVGAAQHATAAAIVKQSVHRFLEHALFVAHDNVRRVQFHELLQPVVAVDDAAVEIVKVRSGETAAVQRHERTQLRRKHGNDVENHPLRLVAALAEGFEDSQALGVLDALLERGIGLHLFAELIGKLVHFDAAEQFLDGFRAHLGSELAGIFLLKLAIFFFGQHFALAKNGDFARIDYDESLEIEDALEVAHGNVQQIADAAGQALKEPHVRAGRSQFDVAEALAPDLAERDFHAALVADYSAVLHPLVFAAQALPVGDGAENLGTEQAVTLGLEGAVIDGLRLGDFAVGPRANFFRARQADADGIKIGNQAGAIIRAAAIQGCFLPPRLSPGPRPDVLISRTSDRLRTQLRKTSKIKNLASSWGAAALHPYKALIGGFFQLRFLPLHQLDVQAERLQFAHEYVERFRHTRLDARLAFDDGLVNLGAAVNVVGLRR